jgi:glycine cleavage system H protein
LTSDREGGFIERRGAPTPPIRGGTVEYPDDVRYTKEHEWARAEGGRVRIGITDYAQDALGDVVYVDLPDTGTALQRNRPFAEVESTKSVSDVYAPIDGTIVEKNPLLDERPELVNEEPYGDGWLVVVEPGSPGALDDLLDAAAYEAFLREPGEA